MFPYITLQQVGSSLKSRICSGCFSRIPDLVDLSSRATCISCFQNRGPVVFSRKLSYGQSAKSRDGMGLSGNANSVSSSGSMFQNHRMLRSVLHQPWGFNTSTRLFGHGSVIQHLSKLSSLPQTGTRAFDSNQTFPSPLTCGVSPLVSMSQVRAYSAGLPKAKKSKSRSEVMPISWKSLAVAAALGLSVLIFMKQVSKEKERQIEENQSRQMGKAKLGGDWELTDHHGKQRSSVEFRGQWLLLYFGFTNCPDICPEELDKIVEVINRTDANSSMPKIQPMMISVDPERDTPDTLQEYLGEFSPRLLGFTGTVEDVQKATRAFRVYFSAGPKDEDNDYIVDHSIISYLVNPEGEFVNYFGQNKTAEEMYNGVQFHIHSYNKEKKK